MYKQTKKKSSSIVLEERGGQSRLHIVQTFNVRVRHGYIKFSPVNPLKRREIKVWDHWKIRIRSL